MKKRMFNDRYGHTDAVLQGKKTVFRSLIKGQVSQCWLQDCMNRNLTMKIEGSNLCAYTTDSKLYYSFGLPYRIGEIVAVAQSYYSIMESGVKVPYKFDISMTSHKGWTNKMSVCADLMPRQIRILDVRAERLQDITDEDCLREGITQIEIKTKGSSSIFSESTYRSKGIRAGIIYSKQSPREAFASLIDKISGKGTWNSNPFVWRIEFELTK